MKLKVRYIVGHSYETERLAIERVCHLVEECLDAEPGREYVDLKIIDRESAYSPGAGSTHYVKALLIYKGSE